MRRRASNVYGRPVFLARVGGIAFALTLIAFAFLARSAPRELRGRAPRAREWRYRGARDWRRNARRRGCATRKTRSPPRARSAARAQCSVTRSLPRHAHVETRSPRPSAELTRLLERSDDAPLVASFRALGTAAPMAGEPRVARLLDSLNDLDKARSDFGSSDGVDPIFVALTARVGSIGHELEAWREQSERAMRREIESLTPPPVAGVGDRHGAPRSHSRFSGARCRLHLRRSSRAP